MTFEQKRKFHGPRNRYLDLETGKALKQMKKKTGMHVSPTLKRRVLTLRDEVGCRAQRWKFAATLISCHSTASLLAIAPFWRRIRESAITNSWLMLFPWHHLIPDF